MKASTGFRLFICAAALTLPLHVVNAAEPGGCDAFAWPIATELQWMKATDNEAVASGAKLATPPEKAIALTLQPMSAVTFPVAPTSRRKANPNAFGGIVNFDGAPAPGLYQDTVVATITY